MHYAVVVLFLLVACGKTNEQSSPGPSIYEQLHGAWKTPCTPATGTGVFWGKVVAAQYRRGFNEADAWIDSVYFSDSNCSMPLLRTTFGGTYELGETTSNATMSIAVNYIVTTLAVTLHNPDAVQEANNNAYCGGGFETSRRKKNAGTECQVAGLPWRPRPFDVISLQDNTLRVGEYNEQLNGYLAETRPANVNQSLSFTKAIP